MITGLSLAALPVLFADAETTPRSSPATANNMNPISVYLNN
jgi:hypothetical protein